MSLDDLLGKLWKNYSEMNPQAKQIHQLLEDRNEEIQNDHIAFRTFSGEKVGISVMEKSFIKWGYRRSGEYEFTDKKLSAVHYLPPLPHLPKIFISELRVNLCSPRLQAEVEAMSLQIPEKLTLSDFLLTSGILWKPVSYETYKCLLAESEYAAWMSAFGFRPNHFTVNFNSLSSFKSLQELNIFLRAAGFSLNSAGGEIKGSPADLLEQSSTMAEPVDALFAEGVRKIPGCYYEFARRYPMLNGEYFQGFIPKSADKLFESTDNS